jgi:hypothetical protein
MLSVVRRHKWSRKFLSLIIVSPPCAAIASPVGVAQCKNSTLIGVVGVAMGLVLGLGLGVGLGANPNAIGALGNCAVGCIGSACQS